jgi:hypothetical protein
VTVPATSPNSSKLVSSALIAGGLAAAVLVAVSWGRLLLTDPPATTTTRLVAGLLVEWLLSTVALAPSVLAIVLVVAAPSWRTVAGGATLVYLVDLVLIVGQLSLRGLPAGLELAVLAVPFERVITVLAVAVAVWVAYDGGFERLAAATGGADHHPLFALVADDRIGPALTVQRGLVAAVLAASVAVGGLVLTGQIEAALQAMSRSGETGGIAVDFSQAWLGDIGISPGQVPFEWLLQAAFLLGVTLVTGPRLRPRDFLKGVGVVFTIQSVATLLPPPNGPDRPVGLWTPTGPLLTPISDSILLVGIAMGIWLVFHSRFEMSTRLS